MEASTGFSNDYKVPVTMKIDNHLVKRIQEMKQKCTKAGVEFSLTAIFVKAVELELAAKERLCAEQDADSTRL